MMKIETLDFINFLSESNKETLGELAKQVHKWHGRKREKSKVIKIMTRRNLITKKGGGKTNEKIN